jgi:DNA-binding NarL/FixJ family response regulator
MDEFKTLVVEDSLAFRQTLVDILTTKFPGMILEEACDGKEALQKVADLLPDLIFMDIKLPGENGLQLTQRIKQKYPQIKIIILTSYDLPEYRNASSQYGADHFIVKGSTTYGDILFLVESILKELGFNNNGSEKRPA